MVPLNRVVHEGATNTTITCESNSTAIHWALYPFAFTGINDKVLPTTRGEPNPSFYESFAIDHSEGTDVYSLVVFNATIHESPQNRANYSTAGIYSCTYTDTYGYAHLVVIRKYELTYLNDLNYFNVQSLRHPYPYNLRRDTDSACVDSLNQPRE